MKKLLLTRTGIFSILLMLMVALFPLISMAQQSKTPNNKLAEIALSTSNPGWIDFKPGLAIKAEKLFTSQKEAFGLRESDSMGVFKTETDNLGYTHSRFNQFYRGVKVEGSTYIVHEKAGMLQSGNGKLIPEINMDVTPDYTEVASLTAAMTYLNAEEYLWQNEDAQKTLRIQKKNESATWYPTGELVLVNASATDTLEAATLRLCWKFDIFTHKPGDANRVFVDAKTGNVLRTIPLSMSCNTGATGTTTWHGAHTFNTTGATNILKDDCFSPNYWVRNHNQNTDNSISDYTDADNIWNATAQKAAVESMWAIDKIWNYYSIKHSRNSWDNAAGLIIAYNNAKPFNTVNNSCWQCDGNAMTLGAGSTSAPTDDWNAIDIIGHEFTHGVVQSSAGLVYSYQSGALNESFADIFGTCIERYAEGNANPDWLLGEDNSYIIRDFANPGTYGQPDTYLGTNWYSGTGDNGGVHTNSGVQNFWFYLLTVGGSGTNDNGDAYAVSSIGMDKAAAIAYRGLTSYLSSNSVYIDTRSATIHAAEDLYGVCSNEAIQTAEAWYAVGVGPSLSYYNPTVSGTLVSTTYEAINILTSSGVVNSGITATLQAAKKVSLVPPFNAKAGSTTRIKINQCSVTKH